MAELTVPRMLMMSDYYDAEGAGTGGAGSSARRIAGLLERSGMIRGVVVGFGPEPTGIPEGKVYNLRGRDLRASARENPIDLVSGLWNFEAAHRLEKVLKQFDPNETVVCLHQWTRYLTPAAISLLKSYRTIVYTHDYFWMCPTGAYFNFRTSEPCELNPGGAACLGANCDRGGFADKAFRDVRHLLKEAFARHRAENLIFMHISEQSKALVSSRYPEYRHYVLNHSMELNVGDEAPSIGYTEKEFDIAYFGRVEAEKGVMRVAEAASQLGLRMLVVGSGSAVEELAEKFPAITIMNWVARADVPALMRRCKAVTLPSLWPETWGLVVPEALSLGVPVLVSSRAGSSELISKFGGGEIFEPDDPDDVLRKLRSLMLPEAWTRFRDDAKNVVERAELGSEHFARKFADILRSAWRIE